MICNPSFLLLPPALFVGPRRKSPALTQRRTSRTRELQVESALLRTSMSAQHIGFCDEVEPFGRIGGKLHQFAGESAQREENVTGIVLPARLGQAGCLRLQCA